mmetsp:Transcript_53054/g.121842  ORF Transcript_53054/g.121842 Transcript_53054/m.121842 type:complete len:292 (+) Transcript_53054:321-1196(+)
MPSDGSDPHSLILLSLSDFKLCSQRRRFFESTRLARARAMGSSSVSLGALVACSAMTSMGVEEEAPSWRSASSSWSFRFLSVAFCSRFFFGAGVAGGDTLLVTAISSLASWTVDNTPFCIACFNSVTMFLRSWISVSARHNLRSFAFMPSASWLILSSCAATWSLSSTTASAMASSSSSSSASSSSVSALSSRGRNCIVLTCSTVSGCSFSSTMVTLETALQRESTRCATSTAIAGGAASTGLSAVELSATLVHLSPSSSASGLNQKMRLPSGVSTLKLISVRMSGARGVM